MGLIQRVKGWLLPHSSGTDAEHAPVNGTAVAGFVKRVPADVEIVTSANIIRSLAALMPPAVAAATPLRTIPLFLVPIAVEPAEVAIIHHARPAPKLHLVHNVALNDLNAEHFDAGRFLLAARLASVAHLNTRAGRQPVNKAARNISSERSPVQTTSPQRPRAEKPSAKQHAAKRASPKSAAKGQCFVRVQSNGTAAVVAVPQRAKRRAA